MCETSFDRIRERNGEMFLRKLWGSVLFGVARFIDVVLGGLIAGLKYVVAIVSQIRQFVVAMLGCAAFILFMNPFILLWFSANPAVLVALLVILIFPLLGTKFVSWLEYGKYVSAEYLYDKADAYRLGRANNRDFKSYGDAYKRREEENRRREQARQQEAYRRAQEQRQRQQQEEWDRLFREWFGGGFQGGAGSYYRPGGQQGGYQGYQQRQNDTFNPTGAFNETYKKSTQTLGLPLNTDIYQVKLAYRKLAKQYHPDINQSPGAKEKFQEINNAYEFLTEENIARYKQINK